MERSNNPRYPVYIVSKGRWESRLTARALDWMGVPYRVVVEPPEYDRYAAVIDRSKLLALPFADLGLGSIPARNWVWDHALAEGHARHWVLDDNIGSFLRFQNNRRYLMSTGSTFAASEDFVDRYRNVALAGMQYVMFAPIKERHEKPFALNTRIYSCILIDNALPLRWRGKYNEDTDLSLRVLKAGYCTILFYAFLVEKPPTMSMPGGNTDLLYRQSADFDGRLEMARSLQRQHPDLVKVVRKWGRWQHRVDYRPFAANRLDRRDEAPTAPGVDNYGMTLRLRAPGEPLKPRAAPPPARPPRASITTG